LDFDENAALIRFRNLLSVPPTSIEIVGHRPGSRLDVREHEELELGSILQNSVSTEKKFRTNFHPLNFGHDSTQKQHIYLSIPDNNLQFSGIL
jgi:hypothetical protein